MTQPLPLKNRKISKLTLKETSWQPEVSFFGPLFNQELKYATQSKAQHC